MSAYKIVVSNGPVAEQIKKYKKGGGKRNNNTNVSNVIYWRTFLQKYTREHDKHESTPKLNCVGNGSGKPSAAKSFIFTGIAGPKSLRMISGEAAPPSPAINVPRFPRISTLSHYA